MSQGGGSFLPTDPFPLQAANFLARFDLLEELPVGGRAAGACFAELGNTVNWTGEGPSTL